MQTADDGQRSENWRLWRIPSGATSRSIVSKPRRAKKASALVVSRNNFSIRFSFARSSARSNSRPPSPARRRSVRTAKERRSAAGPKTSRPTLPCKASPSTATTTLCREDLTSSLGRPASASKARKAGSSSSRAILKTSSLMTRPSSAFAALGLVAAVRGNHRVGAALVGHHTPSRVDPDVAAGEEHFLDLLPTTLHSGLHTRQRDPQHLGGVLLSHSLKLGQHDRLAVRGRQRGHEH